VLISDNELKEEFLSTIKEFALDAHGCCLLEPIRKFFAEKFNIAKKKVADRALFLSSLILCDPIRFIDVKNQVWTTDEEQEKNNFPFLQGDVVQTISVSVLGQVSSLLAHKNWIILTPSCDVVRKDFIRVAPVYLVEDFFIKGTNEQKNLYNMFALGLKFANHRFFSLPTLLQGNNTILGGVADFSAVPAFIKREHARLATPITSLTLYGWHLFNAVIQENETRANFSDELKIRNISFIQKS
jgi:hypothetical protein